MKLNEKLIIGFLAAAMTAGAAHAKKMKGDDLSNMVIEGENRLLVHETVPDLEWTPEVFKDLPDLLQDSGVVGGLKPPELKEPPVPLASRVNLQKTADPWLDNILEKPILTLRITPESADIDRKYEWVFQVKDSRGQTIYSKKKKGQLPPILEWDGFEQGGKPLHVGFDYSYTLSIIDEAGNPQRYSGKPFNVPAFQYGKGSNITAHVFPEVIFRDRSSLKFSRDGANYMREIRDLIRTRYGKTVTVTAFDNDVKFGLARANNLKKYLATSLDYPEDKMRVASEPLRKGLGHRYVEIAVD